MEKGSVTIARSGEILMICAEGEIEANHTFNLIGRIREVNAAHENPLRGLFIDLRRWEGITPEALESYLAMLDWCADQELVALATVTVPDNFQRVSQARIDALAQKIGMRWFTSIEAAFGWLVDQGIDSAE